MKKEMNSVKKCVNMLATGLAALIVMTTSFVMPVYAATGTWYASGLTAPGGQVWLGNNLWVADHVQGFCRLDAQLSGDSAINVSTCIPKFDILTGIPIIDGARSPGQPTAGPLNADGTQFVYVPDNSRQSLGVWRYTFDHVSQTITGSVLLAPTAGLGGNIPTATALGPDGKLYIGFLKNGNILRLTTPSGTTQLVEQVGQTSDGKGVTGIAFASSTLYLAQRGGFVTKIALPGGAGVKAVLTPITGAPSPTAITSDGTDVLFIADTPTIDSTIIRYTVSTNTQDIYATMGMFPDLTTTTFKFVSGLSLDPTGNLFIGDDPSSGVQVLQGHIWTIAAGAAPEVAGSGTPPPPPALIAGVLNASGITAPGGSAWLGDALTGHLWTSDHVQGFCRLDNTGAINGNFTINVNTCIPKFDPVTGIPIIDGAISPGQPALDPATNSVYVPDNSRQSKGVWRYTFDPATQTITSSVLLASNAGLGGNTPTATALGADGKLYVGFLKNGNIVRITTPSGASQTVEAFGGTSDGKGVTGIAFVGSDLYLAQRGGFVTRIGPAGGKAVPTPINAASPTAITSDGVNVLFVADTPVLNSNIIRYTISPNSQVIYANMGLMPDGTTKPFQGVSGLSLDPATARLFVGDDPTQGVQVLQGRIWTIFGVLGEYCHNPRGIDQPCRGNKI